MSKLWRLNLFLFFLIIAVFIIVMMKMKIESHQPMPIPEAKPIEKPTLEITEEVESIYGYTSTGETVPGSAEMVHLTKALTVKNPNDYAVTIDKIKTKVYDSSGEDLYSLADDMFWASGRRTLAPGEVAHFAATDMLTEIRFREDFGYSQSEISYQKASEYAKPYTNLVIKSFQYEFDDADPGNTILRIQANVQNNSADNVDTSELDFVVLFYDHEGKLIGGDTETQITYTPERIRPNEEKQISFEGALIGRQFSKNISSIKVFAGCDICRAR